MPTDSAQARRFRKSAYYYCYCPASGAGKASRLTDDVAASLQEALHVRLGLGLNIREAGGSNGEAGEGSNGNEGGEELHFDIGWKCGERGF